MQTSQGEPLRQIVLVSFTALNAGGGVPRWNRDFIAGFPGTKHYSYDDLPTLNKQGFGEWDCARLLGSWLYSTRRVTRDTIVISDGFWGEYLSALGMNVISVAHGIWSHLTKEDVDAGKQPEFPVHHVFQVNHRGDHIRRGGKIVAVSRFIQEQMKLQWGFDSTVINNAIDLEKFKPLLSRAPRERPLVIHGVTNSNKGFEHIKRLEQVLDGVADVMLMDTAAERLGYSQEEKYKVIGEADLIVQPSAYEGNSYFILEALASDVPVVAYNVGLLNSISTIAKENGIQAIIGSIIDRKYRSPDETAKVGKFILDSVVRDRSPYNPREVASLFSIERFHVEWRKYLEDYERHLESR